jgi:hypothetical protein
MEDELNAVPAPEATEAPAAPEPSEALDSITAGYNRQRGIEAEPVAAAPEAEPAPAPEPVAETPPEPPQPTVEEKLATLQQSIADLNGTPASVRKIYGELGSIKQALKELRESKPAATAAEPSPDLAAILAEVDRVAEEFPDLAGPLANAIKAMGARAPAAAAPAVQLTEEEFNARYEARKQAEARETLAEEHADYETVRETPEYKDWLKTLDDGYRTRFLNTWNPNVVSKGLTEFKTWRAAAQAAKASKDARLKAAITPAGEGSPGPSQLPDSAGISVGYNKVRRLRTAA